MKRQNGPLTHLPLNATRTAAADMHYWLKEVPCQLNPPALPHLLQDEPAKRRKVYLEFTTTDWLDVLGSLAEAGFDMGTLKQLNAQTTGNTTPPPATGLRCLITGPVDAILQFLYQNPRVRLASIDLPEYSWLSASGGETPSTTPGLSSLEH